MITPPFRARPAMPWPFAQFTVMPLAVIWSAAPALMETGPV
jgi:hypothetical protein